ncbi:hypothetical protein DTO271D3_5460 [Paecilomyces variotii]|nr:hypothetical protein DTO271D3_5460 [Paecilomyces variotii]
MGFAEIVNSAPKLKMGSPTEYEQPYLLGFRGILVIETFLWTFLRTFAPTTVYVSADPNGPFSYQIVRKIFSVLFWNEYFLYGAIIFLSARSIAIPFIRNPKAERAAMSMMCRGITLWFPVAVSVAIATLAFAIGGTEYIADFKTRTSNHTTAVPYVIPNAFAYFNSVFNMFWTTRDYNIQAASTAFPTGTLWVICAVYMQSYTVYMTMLIIPYTRNKWRVQGAFVFVLCAWWCQSWAWFTISGLILADMVMNMNFKERAQRGIPVWTRANGSRICIPVFVPAGLCLIGGLLMQYLWVAYRPDLFDKEWLVHTDPYYTASLNFQYATRHTQARDDAYLMVIGIFLFLESYDILQRIFSNGFLVALGKRSLSYFLVQSNMMYIVGIRVFESLYTKHHISFGGSNMVALITCLVVTIPLAELFYRLVELPSKHLAHKFYEFITA